MFLYCIHFAPIVCLYKTKSPHSRERPRGAETVWIYTGAYSGERVLPMGSLITRVAMRSAGVVINKTPTPADRMATLVINEPIGRTLSPD